MDLRPCGDGFAFAAQDPAFGRSSPGGAAETLQGPRTADMRAKFGRLFEISSDAASVRFGLGYGEEKPVLFDLAAGSLTDSPERFRRPRARARRRPAGDGLGGQLPSRSSRASRSASTITRSPTRSRCGPTAPASLSGPTFWLRAFDAAGKRMEAAGAGRSLGRRLQRGRPDPRRRLWRRHDPLAARDRRRRNCWRCSSSADPQMGRLDADRLLHGVGRRRGSDRLASQPRLDARGRLLPRLAIPRRFNRPDIVKLVLKTRDEAEAVGRPTRRRSASPTRPSSPPAAAGRDDRLAQAGGDVRWGNDRRRLRRPFATGLAVDRVDAQIDGSPADPRISSPCGQRTRRPRHPLLRRRLGKPKSP